MLSDIQELLMWKWLNVSIIQVWGVYLNSVCAQLNFTLIGFVCPSQISFDMIQGAKSATAMKYLIQALDNQTDRQFILVPYHEKNNWVLVVICTNLRVIYVSDPIECDRNLRIKYLLNMVFKSVKKNDARGNKNPVFQKIKCHQQPGGYECGYYVMRYMYEICTKYFDKKSLNEAFQNQERTQWRNLTTYAISWQDIL